MHWVSFVTQQILKHLEKPRKRHLISVTLERFQETQLQDEKSVQIIYHIVSLCFY